MSDARPVPVLLLISAPSGAGKTTVCEQLLATTPSLTRAVTCTTRRPRGSERDGVDYHFLAPEEFERRIDALEFLEYATVYGRRYGTLRAEVLGRLRAGQDLLLNIDVQGAASVRTLAAVEPELRRSLVSVFLMPPSLDELERRLVGRGQDSPDAIHRRLMAARSEMTHWRQFDYLIVSDGIPETLRRLKAIYEAEKMRQFRAVLPVAKSVATTAEQTRNETP